MDKFKEIKIKKPKKETKEVRKTPKPKKVSQTDLLIKEAIANTVFPDNYEMVLDAESLNLLISYLKEYDTIALDTETLGLNPFVDDIVGMSLYMGNKGFYIPIQHVLHNPDFNAPRVVKNCFGTYSNEGGDVQGKNGYDYLHLIPRNIIIEAIKPYLEDRTKKYIFHNYTFDYKVLKIWMCMDVECYVDTILMIALLDENVSRALKDFAAKAFHIKTDKYAKLFGKSFLNTTPILMDSERKGNITGVYAVNDTKYTLDIFNLLMPTFEKKPVLKSLLFELEMPFLYIVRDAEMYGTRFDLDYINNTVKPKLQQEVNELYKNTFAELEKCMDLKEFEAVVKAKAKSKKDRERGINLNSTKQLADILFNYLKLPHINKDKPQCTDKAVLKKLSTMHPAVKYLVEYRAKSKLLTAFTDTLTSKTVNGRLHPSFRSIGAVTGRMSCTSPNLQQIPAGPLVRNAFIADEGRLLVSIDYSSQEVRWLAEFSKDPVLLDMFKNNKDMHNITGCMVYNIKHEDRISYEDFTYYTDLAKIFLDKDGNVDQERVNNPELLKNTRAGNLLDDIKFGKELTKARKKAKIVNFSIIYGVTKKGLSASLECPEDEAQSYIDGFYKTYKGVKAWVAANEKEIIKNKYVETILGRKRRLYKYFEDPNKYWLKYKAFRQGGNAKIQGKILNCPV